MVYIGDSWGQLGVLYYLKAMHNKEQVEVVLGSENLSFISAMEVAG